MLQPIIERLHFRTEGADRARGSILGIGFVSIVYLAISFLIYWGRTKAGDVVLLSSDAAAYASVAAATMAPERFHADLWLSDHRGMNFGYFGLPYYLVLTAPYFNTFGNALAVLLLIATPVQLLGFHFLARQLGLSHGWSLVYALLSLIVVQTGLGGEYWGIGLDPLPRQLFQAVFPFLLGAALRFQNSYSGRLFVLVACGALIYVHSHSALTQAFAIWCGLVVLKPPQTSWTTHAVRMILIGITFVLIASPYAYYFVLNTAGVGTADPSIIRQISESRLGEFNFVPIELARYVIVSAPFLAMVALGLQWVHRNKPGLSHFRTFILGWLGGLLIVSVLVPAIDSAQAWFFDRMPLEYDLIRSLRYLIPLGWLFCVLVLAKRPLRFNELRRAESRMPLLMLGFGLLTLIFPHARPPQTLISGASCALMMKCETSSLERDMREVVAHARLLPANTPFFTEAMIDGLTIRQAARQPVVFTEKEGGWLLYARHYPGLLEWWRRKQQFLQLTADGKATPASRDGYYRRLFMLACGFGAKYIVIEQDGRSLSGVRSEDIVVAGSTTSLVRLRTADDTTNCS